MEMNDISGIVVDAAYEVHTTLGPGLLEHVYKECLKAELLSRDLKVISEIGIPVVYKNTTMELGYRIDLLVEDVVIIELKAVYQLAPIHRAQLLTYLRLSGKPLGLLLNFNSPLIKDGIVRIIN